MPIVSNIYYELEQAQNGKRVRLEVSGATPVSVLVGNPIESWTDGCYIEVVRVSPDAIVQFEPYDGSVTLNALSGTTQLLDGEYGRVSYVSPGVWDLHIHRLPVPGPTNLYQLDDVVSEGAAINNVLIFDGSVWVPGNIIQNVKPAPLSTDTTTATAVTVGSAAQHNIHYRFLSATDITVTVEPDSFWTGTQEYWEGNFNPSNPREMPDGGNIIFTKLNTGNVNFVAAPGVTINTPDTLTISRIKGKATLIKAGPNEWDLEGNIGT